MKKLIVILILLFIVSVNIRNISYSHSLLQGSIFLNSTPVDTSKPVIVHFPRPFCNYTSWPSSVSSYITDNTGIDSAWVKWYRSSSPAVVKQFKLINISGSTYAGTFNSSQSEISYGMTIYYRIFAQDNSSSHNRDSSGLFSFNISYNSSLIGTDTTTIGYPYYTYYMDSRTDLLYTASDIIAGGGSWGLIKRIGFYVTSNSTQVMNGFKIKMQFTSASSINTFTSSGWTTVYSGNYAINGTGWQSVTLQNPISWNGTSNLLIEICFNNSSYSSNTFIHGTHATGKVVHNHQDLATGDGCVDILTRDTSSTALPNLFLDLDVVINNNNNQSGIPETYTLKQNFPNPFNPVTLISYSVPKASVIKISVYDATGRETAILINEFKQPGFYNIQFDASNLASGFYICKMESDGFSSSVKMLVVK